MTTNLMFVCHEESGASFDPDNNDGSPAVGPQDKLECAITTDETGTHIDSKQRNAWRSVRGQQPGPDTTADYHTLLQTKGSQ